LILIILVICWTTTTHILLLPTLVRSLHLLVLGPNLAAPHMRILPVLMVLQDQHLHQHAPDPIPAIAALALQIRIYPAARLLPLPLPEFREVVVAGAGEELHLRGSVRLVMLPVKEHAEFENMHHLEEVDGEGVWLWAVRLPVAVRGRCE
ncbi:MAG: hypothetical protein LQ346_003699, partial [Caloplaca aetnensis]